MIHRLTHGNVVIIFLIKIKQLSWILKLKSVFQNPISMVLGPTLNEKGYHLRMVTSPDGLGVILIGVSQYWYGREIRELRASYWLENRNCGRWDSH